MNYEMEDFVMANFCLYSYEDPELVADKIFRDGLRFGGNEWAFKPSNCIINTALEIQCYIFTSTTSGDVAVAIRGTKNCRNWIDINFKNIFYVNWPASQPLSQVGEGWYNAWNSISSDVILRLSAMLQPGTRIFVTGHSMGAAIAVIATVDIWQELQRPDLKMKMVTFASPLVGNDVFVRYFEALANEFGTYLLYRDPNDVIYYANDFLGSTRFSDPCVDFKYVFSTRRGVGHSISNYINLLNSGRVEYMVDSGTPALWPDDTINHLTIAIAVSNNLVVDDPNIPPINLSLIAGVNEDGSGGIELPIYPEVTPFFKPGTMRYYSFEGAVLKGLKVFELQRCKFLLTMTCQADTGICNIDMNRPVLMDGIQIIANGFPMFTDYAIGVGVSMYNPDFMLEIPTPRFNIVGGCMEVTHDDSSYETLDLWGDTTGRKVAVSNARCWTQKWGKDSYGYTFFYLKPTGAVLNNGQNQVVGGRFDVTNNQDPPWEENIFWGERSDDFMYVSNNYCWTPGIGTNYGYLGLYFLPKGAAVTNQPRVIGGRMIASDSASIQPPVQVLSWGESSAYEVQVCNGGCYSEKYGGDSYGYTSFYTDRPVLTKSAGIKKLRINITHIQCVKTQEGWNLDSRDEIYLILNGVKVWPGTGWAYSFGDDDIANVDMIVNIDTVTPARLEMWENDTFGDDQLYEYFFDNRSMLAEDTATHENVALQDCTPGKEYYVHGRKLYGGRYNYYLKINVNLISG